MPIAIAGGSGFIGRELTRQALGAGYAFRHPDADSALRAELG